MRPSGHVCIAPNMYQVIEIESNDMGTGQRQLFQALYSSFHQEFQSDTDDIRRCSDDVKEAISLAKAYIDEEERQLQIKERNEALRSRNLLTTWLGRKKTEDDTLRELLARQEERSERKS
jgi:hypothetical protein